MKDKIKNLFARIKKFIPEKKEFIYVALGDSTVEGVGSSHSSKTFPSVIFEAVKQENRRAKFYNLGKSRAKVEDVINHQLNEAIRLKPDLVTIAIGANDIRTRTKLSQFERDISYLISSLNKSTGCKIVLNGLPDMTHVPAIPFLLKIYAKYMVKKFNDILRQQAEKSNVIFIDLQTGSKVFAKKYPEMISADGLHPSDLGYAFWAAAIISQAKDALIKGGDRK